MDGESFERIIEDIYEAAAVANKWPHVLQSLTELISGFGASMFSFQPTGERWVSTPSMEQIIADFAALGRPDLNSRSPRALGLRHPGFITDLDGFTEEEIEKDRFYQEFLRPRGLGWCAGTAIFIPGGDSLIISIERRFDLGPVAPHEIALLDNLRPHIARAAAFSARLALERARAAAEALGLLGLPAAVLGKGYRLLSTNALFDALIPSVFRDQRHRVTLVNVAADALLSDALARDAERVAGAVQSIPLAASEDRQAMVLHLVPIRGAARDVFTSAKTIILATPVVSGSPPSQQLLEGLFDLTPAEARVARAICAGETVEQIASGLGITRNTVRIHLRRVFAKTGTHRQAELVRLVAGTIPLG